MAKEIYVRLKPYAPRRGYKTQRYSYKGQIYLGGQRPNWYQVSEAFAEELSTHIQVHNDPDSKPMFDIVDGDLKREIEEKEQTSFLAGLGYNAATIAPPHSIKNPGTTDIRSDDEKASAMPEVPAAPVAAEGGRGSAVPKPRTRRAKKTKTGALTTGGLSGEAGDDKKAGDGEDEG